MIKIISPAFKSQENVIDNCIINFNASGKIFGDGKRNIIKLFDLNGNLINIKSFKVPNLPNKIIYKYFRKSKACRSFEYANFLLKNNIGTPKPIAYFENYNWLGLKESYYVSEHINYDLTYRELVQVPNFEDRENILRQFVHFCFLLHQNGIEFKDHTPGNTLIQKQSEGYKFFLVDLNRMEFHKSMSFCLRMKNLSRLTPLKEMVQIMSNEYAKLSGEDENLVFETLWKYTSEFQARFHNKKKWKKRFLFWRKH